MIGMQTLVSVILLLLAIIANPVMIHAVSSPTTATGSIQGLGMLSMVKLHTNATGLATCKVDVATVSGSIITVTGTLFARIRIVLNMTWSQSNSTYSINLASYALIVTQKNIVVANSTNINQNQSPTNILQAVTLFPALPVILILSFAPVCVAPSAVARLYYNDGLFGFVFDLP